MPAEANRRDAANRFRAEWDRCAEPLRGFLSAFATDADHRADLEQQTWVRAWRGRSGFAGGTFWGWLRKIAYSVAIDDTRAAKRVRETRQHLASLPIGHAGNTEDRVERAELRLALQVVIEEQLTPREREVVLLRFLEGWPARETAEHLGISQPAMRTHLGNGLRKLRNVLRGRRDDFI